MIIIFLLLILNSSIVCTVLTPRLIAAISSWKCLVEIGLYTAAITAGLCASSHSQQPRVRSGPRLEHRHRVETRAKCREEQNPNEPDLVPFRHHDYVTFRQKQLKLPSKRNFEHKLRHYKRRSSYDSSTTVRQHLTLIFGRGI